MFLRLVRNDAAPAPLHLRQLRSVRSEQESFVLFINMTGRNVNLYWINYKGERTFYLTLRPLNTVQINTFRSHPWIFLDQQTGEHMQVGNNDVFWPQPYHVRDARDPRRRVPHREQVFIHFPMRTLRENCLWRVVGVLQAAMPTDMAMKIVDRLGIPYTVKADLKARLQAIQAHRESVR